MRTILLIMIGASFLLASETVITSSAGLMWQDNSEAKNTTRKWKEALNYCAKLSLAGHSDWRLPSIKELQSIVDVGRYKPSIQKGFKNVNTSLSYWSSSVHVSNSKYAWIVSFKSGYTNNDDKTGEYCVRCVRGKQSL